MKDIIKGVASGKISIYKVTPDNTYLLLASSNEILPNANDLLALILSGDDTAKITRIRLYDGVTLKIDAPITNKSVETNIIAKFIALIQAGDLVGTINKCLLGPTDSGTLGNFAQAVFANMAISGDDDIAITWEITFNFGL